MVTISRKLFNFLAFLFIFSIISSIAYANGQTVFGPKDCTIKWWHTHISLHTFEVNDLSDGLIIIAKNTPNKKIKAGYIILNWGFIGLEDFLSSSDTVFEKNISLKSENNVIVFLRGTPGASLAIEIRQKSVPAHHLRLHSQQILPQLNSENPPPFHGLPPMQTQQL